MNYYEILGVDVNANEQEIKKAYKEKAKQYHPDINKSPNAINKMKKINKIYEVLSNCDRRKKYDEYINKTKANLNINQKKLYSDLTLKLSISPNFYLQLYRFTILFEIYKNKRLEKECNDQLNEYINIYNGIINNAKSLIINKKLDYIYMKKINDSMTMSLEKLKLEVNAYYKNLECKIKNNDTIIINIKKIVKKLIK